MKLSDMKATFFTAPSPLSICNLDFFSHHLGMERDYLVEHLMNLAIKPHLSPFVIRYKISRDDKLPLVPKVFVVNFFLRQRINDWCVKRGLSPSGYISAAIEIVYGSEDLTEKPSICLDELFDPDRVCLSVGSLLEKGSRCKPT